MNKLKVNYDINFSLKKCLKDGGDNLKIVPQIYWKIVNDKTWCRYMDAYEDTILTPKNFKDFIEKEYPEGIGINLDTLEKVLKMYDDIAYKDLRNRIAGKHGGNADRDIETGKYIKSDTPKIDNIKLREPPTGTSKLYALNKLEKERPDLYEEVINENISPNAAMIQAGYRKKKVQVELNVDSVVKMIKKYFKYDDIIKIKKLL